MGLGWISGKGWLWGRRSEEWYRNELRGVLVEFSKYVNSIPYFRDSSPYQRQKDHIPSPFLSHRPSGYQKTNKEQEYEQICIELITKMKKLRYRYKDITDDIKASPFPGDYPWSYKLTSLCR